MIRFPADEFCRASGQIGQMWMDIRHGAIPRQMSIEAVSASIRVLEKECVNLGLPATLAQIKRVQESISRSNNSLNLDFWSRALMEVYVRLVDELEARKLYALDVEGARYFEGSQFSQTAAERFPEAIYDMEEAGKCFALDRHTACVFHLMRVTEYGLAEVARFLKLHDPLGPNWDSVIKKIDSELKADYKDRKFKGHSDLLSHVSSHLNAVKIAWRNRTMHIDKKYTFEEARDIYNATCGFMRYIAENFPKDSGGVLASIRGMIGL